MFRRRFRMRRSLFLRIEGAITAHDNYFTQKIDVVGVRGLSSLQKITVALRMLAYKTAADSVDEYIRIGESTAVESFKRFVKAVVEVFGTEYLRRPNDEDVVRLLAVAKQRGFPGSLNDINVLDRSNVFNDLAEGHRPKVNFSINGHDYNMGYYLADGIYPSWPTFVKTISAPQDNKRKYFAVAQELARKDVERAFGVLQSRFAMICGPSRFWDIDTMKYIMTSCIILHNMIVENERDLHISDYNYDTDVETPTISMNVSRIRDIKEFIQTHQQIRNKQTHIKLQNDLIEHLWQSYGGNM